MFKSSQSAVRLRDDVRQSGEYVGRIAAVRDVARDEYVLTIQIVSFSDLMEYAAYTCAWKGADGAVGIGLHEYDVKWNSAEAEIELPDRFGAHLSDPFYRAVSPRSARDWHHGKIIYDLISDEGPGRD